MYIIIQYVYKISCIKKLKGSLAHNDRFSKFCENTVTPHFMKNNQAMDSKKNWNEVNYVIKS